jgi:hypothetical protein
MILPISGRGIISERRRSQNGQVRSDGLEPIPFFIEWAADSEHPSRDSSPGCRLISLSLAYPDPPAVRNVLGSLGIGIEVKQRSTARPQALLDTPKDNVTLS